MSSQSTDIPVSVQDAEIEEPLAGRRSVALIGPNESSRRVVAAALAGSGGADVREYHAYPARFPDVSLILEANYNLIILDVDSDESYALAIVEKLAAGGATVMAYSRRKQQDLILRCMQAGARDFLPLPEEQETERAAEPAAEQLPAPEPVPAAEPAVTVEVAAPVELAPEPVLVPEPVAVPAAAVEQPEPLPVETPVFRFVGVEPPPQKGRSKRLAVVGAGTLLIVGGLAFAFLPQLSVARAGLLARVHPQAAAPAPAAAPAQAAPAAAEPVPQPQQATAPDTTETAPAASPAPAAAAAQPASAPVPRPAAPSAPGMGDQLTAPSRLGGGLKKPVAKDDPAASFGSAQLGGGAALPGAGAFAAQGHPRVEPASTAISAGVAAGMLVRKTEPSYPNVARMAHVSGTVVLDAIITKTGTLRNIRPLTGPLMLQRAAEDAVRTWRYRPYLLNGQPVEVETTISVVFSPDR